MDQLKKAIAVVSVSFRIEMTLQFVSRSYTSPQALYPSSHDLRRAPVPKYFKTPEIAVFRGVSVQYSAINEVE
jgi:hypothetical protein